MIYNLCRTLHLYVQAEIQKNGRNAEIYIGMHCDVKTIERDLKDIAWFLHVSCS